MSSVDEKLEPILDQVLRHAYAVTAAPHLCRTLQPDCWAPPAGQREEHYSCASHAMPSWNVATIFFAA
jgi:hypothetical protein